MLIVAGAADIFPAVYSDSKSAC